MNVNIRTPRLQRELRRDGTVIEQFGFGTWTVGSSPTADVAFQEGDHVDVVTRLSQARRFLPPFLHRLRIDLDQREALGEILGGAYGTPAQQRTRIVIISRSPSTPPRSTSASPWVRPSAPRSSRPPESRALLVALRAR